MGHIVQGRSKANITGGARERQRRELVGGSGGMLALKMLYLETSKCFTFQSNQSTFVVFKLSELP